MNFNYAGTERMVRMISENEKKLEEILNNEKFSDWEKLLHAMVYVVDPLLERICELEDQVKSC